MAQPDLTTIHEQPPESVLVESATPRFSPNEIRELRQQTGRTMEQLLGDGADDADRLQTLAWLQLRRDGHRVRWQDCGDVQLELQELVPDPTSAAQPTNSQRSADSGA